MRGHDNGYHADWSNVQSQARTTDEALKAAGITRVEKQTVSVHSRGGEVIQRLMTLDPSGHALRADRLELHDSLYGSQGAVAQWGRTANGKQVDKVVYVHGTNAAGRDQEIAKVFKGAYVRIDVRDSGTGISLSDQNRIFEPFYTTKPAGKGTGLGLAIVRRIVDRAGGFVRVESRAGAGTTFRIYLPRVAGNG